jgi:hypothetical protein
MGEEKEIQLASELRFIIGGLVKKSVEDFGHCRKAFAYRTINHGVDLSA